MKGKIIKSLLFLSVILPILVWAGGADQTFPFSRETPRFLLPTTRLEPTIVRVTNLLFYFIVLISIVMVLWGGVTLATAGGDPSKVDLARHIIMYALIAIVVGAISWGLINLVASYVGRLR